MGRGKRGARAADCVLIHPLWCPPILLMTLLTSPKAEAVGPCSTPSGQCHDVCVTYFFFNRGQCVWGGVGSPIQALRRLPELGPDGGSGPARVAAAATPHGGSVVHNAEAA